MYVRDSGATRETGSKAGCVRFDFGGSLNPRSTAGNGYCGRSNVNRCWAGGRETGSPTHAGVIRKLHRALALGAVALLFAASSGRAQFEADKLGNILELPAVYPPHWIIVQDVAFFHPNDGKFMVLDADLDALHARFKGMFNGSYLPHFVIAESRPEMYVAETFHSRGQRGERTDVLTIYDKRTLAPVDEVVLPAKRALQLPVHYGLQLIDHERLAVLFNFTPATSVSVIDLEERKFLGEIPIPGCSMVFPTGTRGFSSLCADGSLLTVQLDEAGREASSERMAPFFSVDEDALFEKPAMYEGIAFFPTFLGNLVAIDFSGNVPGIAPPWSLVAGTEGGWRPGGVQPTAVDFAGLLYVLMHPGGAEGTHKDPGVEIWVVDPRSRSRINRIPLRLPVVSIAMTRDEAPLLVATNVEMNIDVYDAGTGRFLRTLSDFGQQTPLLLHGSR